MRLIKVVATNLLIVALCLFILELVFAFTNPLRKLPENGFIDGKLFTWGHEVVVNNFGFRDGEIISPKPEGIYRIIVLGDSLTWGAGLSESQRYTNLAEKQLQKKYPDKNIEVLNFGISGGPMIAHHQILEQLKEHIEADLIVVGFCLNDPQPKSQDYSIEREQYSQKLSILFRVLKSMHAYMPNLTIKIEKSIWTLLERMELVPYWYDALDRVYIKNSNEWMAFSSALEGIYDISNELDLPPPLFIVLNQGSSTILPTYYKDPDPILKKFVGWYNQAENEAKSIGFIAINHTEEFGKELNGAVLGVNILDGHPSYEENKIYANKLVESIKENYIY